MNGRAHSAGVLAKAVLVAAAALAWSGGCAQAPESKRGILDENPAVKIRAMKHAGQVKDTAQACQLIEQLTDEDAAVRFYAIESLKRIIGDDLGYRYYDEHAEREKAVERWRQWLHDQQSPDAATQPASRPAVVNGK